jgi:hypothetical protein
VGKQPFGQAAIGLHRSSCQSAHLDVLLSGEVFLLVPIVHLVEEFPEGSVSSVEVMREDLVFEK